MKVAFHVDQLWFEAPGGIATYVTELLEAIPACDETAELTPFRSKWRRRHPSIAPLTADGRFPGVELPWSIRTLYPSWDLFARPALPPALATADIVHATNPAAIPPVRGGQLLVVTVHDLGFVHFPEAYARSWRWLYRAGLRAAVRRADAILVPSANTAHDLISRAGLEATRVHVTPLASSFADDREAPPLEWLPRPYVLFVGTLEPRKNLVRLVRAYRRVAAKGLPHALVLAGPIGWRTEDLDREVALGGPGEIVRTGGLTPGELDAAYRGADTFVYPSLYEGFGLPVLEAMARGVPTISSNASALPEVYGEAALAIDPRSVEDIADAIERVLTEAPLAADLGSRGRAQANRFSWAETARATLAVYEQLIGAS